MKKAIEQNKFKTFEISKLIDTIMDYKNPNEELDVNNVEKFATYFISGKKLESHISIKNYRFWNSFDEAKVIVEIIDKKQFKIKCKTCKTSSLFLCTHQIHTLANFANEPYSNLLIKSAEIYKQVYQSIMEDFALNKATALQLFSILIDNNLDLTYEIKDKAFESGIAAFKKIKNDQLNRNQEITTVLSIYNEEVKYDEALLWFDTESDQLCKLFTGKKRKDGIITSKIEEIYTTKYLSPQVFDVFSQITKWAIENENIEQNDVRKLLNIIKKDLPILQEKTQYFYAHSYQNKYDKLKAKAILPFNFTTDKIKLVVSAKKNEGFYEINHSFFLGSKPLNQKDIFYKSNLFLMLNNKAYLFENEMVKDIFDRYFRNHILKFFEAGYEAFLETIAFYEGICKVVYEHDFDFTVEPIQKPAKAIYLIQEGDIVCFDTKIGTKENKISTKAVLSFVDENVIYKIERSDVDAFLKEVYQLHPIFEQLEADSEYCVLPHEDLFKDNWFMHFYDKCNEFNIEVFGQGNIKNFNFNKNKASIKTSIKSGIDWFDVFVEMSFGDQIVKPKQWVQALKDDLKYVKLDDGTLGLIPDTWLEKLQKLSTVANINKNEVKISKFNFNMIDDIFEEIDDPKIIKEIAEKRAKIEQIKDLTHKNEKLPKTINAKLRKYQHQGYNWLRFLHEFGFGGILADDMGLGKTLQAICILAFAVTKSKEPNLIVVPRSLLFNWSKELDQFCSSLDYKIYHGSNRKKDKIEIEKSQIIISTYDTIVSDIELFSEIIFNYIILDESQAIKNVYSKRYKAMRKLQGNKRIAMTGTPIENNTFDLFAQMSFVNPGCFVSLNNFKEKFSDPIDNNADEEAAQNLQKIIYPYLLRRTKDQVATDLPSKTESIIYCEMGENQRKIYEDLKEDIKADVYDLIENNGIQKTKFKILEGLLRLRQTCNSPALIDSKRFKLIESAKIEQLVGLLTGDLVNQNVLVFSQFTSMLALIKDRLDSIKIKYAYLDGSTRKREVAVDNFMNNEDCKVFLLSIKAGNTGLNLTKADYVFIVDPWWNPAVEAQAIDRTHRIGQTKNVFAYKMICKNTIEEKIIQLQEKKKKIASDIIQVDDKIFKSLKKNEVMALFD